MTTDTIVGYWHRRGGGVAFLCTKHKRPTSTPITAGELDTLPFKRFGCTVCSATIEAPKA